MAAFESWLKAIAAAPLLDPYAPSSAASVRSRASRVRLVIAGCRDRCPPARSRRAASSANVAASKTSRKLRSVSKATWIRVSSWVARQGMAAGLEEVVVDADGVDTEHAAPDLGEPSLRRRAQGDDRPVWSTHPKDHAAQDGSIELAVGVHRQAPAG